MSNSSPIDQVRVYRSGATITRVTTLTDTPERLQITGLPLCLIDASVRVRVLEGDVRAGAPVVSLFARPPEDLPDAPDEERLRTLQREIQRSRNRIQALRVENELLANITVPSRPRSSKGQRPPPSPMPARVALERFTHRSIDTRLEEIRKIESELNTTIAEELNLADQLHRANRKHLADRQTVSKAVSIPLSGAASKLVVEVSYFVPGARWAPTYQCHVDPHTGHTELHQRAVVSQDTGEDWSNVRLELSTALPLRFSILPKLASIRIGKTQSSPTQRGFRPAPIGAHQLFDDFDRAPKPRSTSSTPHRDWRVSAAPDSPTLDVSADPMVEARFDEETFDEPPSAESILISDAPPPPMAIPGTIPSPARKKRKPLRRRAREEPPPGETSAAPPKPVLPDFATLHLAPPTDPQRGRLTPRDPIGEYRQSLQRLKLRLNDDLSTMLRQAEARAQGTAHLPLPAGTSDITQSSGAFDYTITTAHRVDIPSDRSFHSIALDTLSTHAKLTYVVVPRVDSNVFRVAQVKNPSAVPMLPGPVEVYVDGRYILSSQLPLVGPNARFSLGLGVEQGIRCARNTHFKEKRSGEAVVAMNELHHTLNITLHNQLGQAIQAEIRERLPTPAKNAEVAVEEVNIEPPWEEWDQREVGGERIKGGHRWRLKVDAGEMVELSAHYVVKIYANNELLGGNRREA